ncbi:MAG: transposase [Candidatus Omnitrophica bacterium]|nr:transposase [Candidatus Omnitrophota bacterium]
MIMNAPGEMVAAVWEEIPTHYSGVTIDDYVVMPNHIHGIMLVGSGDGEKAVNKSILTNVIQRYKSFTTRKYIDGVRTKGWHSFDQKLWQRGYYEHTIRSRPELRAIKEYIRNNPKNWQSDEHNK